MSEKIRRYFLKAKEARDILSVVSERLKVSLERLFEGKVNVEVVETEVVEIFLLNGKPVLAKTGGNVFPTLAFNEFLASAPKVVVDMGAVPHVCNGANVMAPGIVRFEGDFGKGDFVVVADEKHGKPIAIGEALQDSEEIKKVKQGVVVKNLHFVGDKIWVLIKKYGA
ncbi:MAG: DUF1947 domain-containing protein [Candidatus Bathyarchaeota archaeon]|jgi:PUA domain protein|nr:DUF1947 domain-containing protein [Candidatus Bathyarchaeota archaeon A05DMB-5]MDH7557861.1 DUF1947 domain-containing protein [Candidatus Bathyarchaeota archaeon]